jgi:hypothetical protein
MPFPDPGEWNFDFIESSPVSVKAAPILPPFSSGERIEVRERKISFSRFTGVLRVKEIG